jgi:hypothetical protein
MRSLIGKQYLPYQLLGVSGPIMLGEAGRQGFQLRVKLGIDPPPAASQSRHGDGLLKDLLAL